MGSGSAGEVEGVVGATDTALVGGTAASPYEPTEGDIVQLEGMGFARVDVVAALRASGGDVEVAADQLLGGIN